LSTRNDYRNRNLSGNHPTSTCEMLFCLTTIRPGLKEMNRKNSQGSDAANLLEQQIAETCPHIDEDMRKSLAKMGAKIATKNPRDVDITSHELKVLQFPLPFDDDTRAVSNCFARCSLFAAVKERQFYKRHTIVGEIQGVKIELCGEQFNQDDHDTMLQLVAMANHKPFGSEITQSINAVLKGMGRSTHLEQRTQLIEQISRLVRGTVRLTTDGVRYEGHLIDDSITPFDQQGQPKHLRHLVYRLNPKFAQLYDNSAYTLFNIQERGKIKGRGSELAKWMHLWIIGNAVQYPHKVETIQQLCGSKDKCLKSFRQKLKQALEILKNIGIISAWEIEKQSDCVRITRVPSKSQVKHVTKIVSNKFRKS